MARGEIGNNEENGAHGAGAVILTNGANGAPLGPTGQISSSSPGTMNNLNGTHFTGTANTITSMTPIDKLYSMQNSYFKSNDCDCLTTVN